MQSDRQYFPSGNWMTSFENQVGFDIAAKNAVGATNFPLENKLSADRIELPPPEICPGNFSIFNHAVDSSHMMFHPVIPQRFTFPGFHVHASSMENNAERWNSNEGEKEISSPFTEDSDEINALLSLDNDQSCESEEEVSTARTNGYDGSSSPDSSCNYSSKSKKVKFSSSQNAHGGGGSSSSCNNERKRKKMQKMVNVLRGMVPGGQRLSTTAVLDEAVKYLKSLRVEVEQNGVDDPKHLS